VDAFPDDLCLGYAAAGSDFLDQREIVAVARSG
jgi:hypothetical protein